MARLEDDGEASAGVKERLWHKLGVPESRVPPPDRGFVQGERGGRTLRHSPGKRPGSPWNRRVSLPVPAAAAIFLFIVFFALFGLLRPFPFGDPDALISVEQDEEAIVPVSDMNGILRYLRNQERGDIMIIRLPESKNFSGSGKPTIIRASDYSRRIPPQ
jgi:hypothetical protein